MKKVFIMTPCRLMNYSVEEVNNYIAKAAEIAKVIAGEDIDVNTNFFLEPVGTDKNGDAILGLRHEHDQLAYMAEEMAGMADADIIMLPNNFQSFSATARCIEGFPYRRNELRKYYVMPVGIADDDRNCRYHYAPVRDDE